MTVVGLAACGDPAIKPPSGPTASPSVDSATQIMRRACATLPRTDTQARDVTFMQSAMIRQGAQLQRVSDDLTGAVPGGNLATDTQLAQANSRQLVDLVAQSNLCSPLKEKLLAGSRDLATADDALAQAAGSGGDVAGALQRAQSRYQVLQGLVQTLPTT
jgi:hypothetical protein